MSPAVNDRTLLPHQLDEKLEEYECYRYVRVGDTIFVDATPSYKRDAQLHITLLYLFGEETWSLSYEDITPTKVKELDLDMGTISKGGDDRYILPMIEQFTGEGITDELRLECREKTLNTFKNVFGLTIEPKYNY